MEGQQATLDMFFRTVCAGPLPGYGIAKAIPATSTELLEIETGSLFRGLMRLEANGWIASSWETSGHNRSAKYCKLTAAGREQLTRRQAKWADFVRAAAHRSRTRWRR